MTGQELLDKLREMPAEQLATPVYYVGTAATEIESVLFYDDPDAESIVLEG